MTNFKVNIYSPRANELIINFYLQDIENLDYLYQLTLGLVVHSQNRDPTLTDKIMGSYPLFTQNLTDVSMMKVGCGFVIVGPVSQRVYELMIRIRAFHKCGRPYRPVTNQRVTRTRPPKVLYVFEHKM